MKHVLLVTGVPGVGKTTLLRSVAQQAPQPLGGFTTDEIRTQGQRVGFRIVPLHGRGRIMAHVDRRSRTRVGHYGVDVAAIETAPGKMAPPQGERTFVNEGETYTAHPERPHLLSARLEGRDLGTEVLM
ncbi:MAG TPA: nucleoside-triphosphatase [Candidatus Margulisiibacteriota bacterium]|nr:nucleoside-triphosphatase [Candidatus Margulisiibacteriota bacterium]